jgi:hypothetical protein
MKLKRVLKIIATSNTNRRPRTMKNFWLNGYSGRQERWALDGHRWVAAEPRRNGFDLWGYQEDTPEIVYLGSGAHEEQLEKLADQFLWVTQRKSTFPFFTKTLPIYSAAWRCRIESERRSAQGRWTKEG